MVVAVLLLVPLAVKWQLPLRIVVAWAVGVGALSGVAAGVLVSDKGYPWAWLGVCLIMVGLLSFGAAAAAFFRDPERDVPDDPSAILSPADGVVVYVREFSAGEAPPMEKQGRPLRLGEFARVDVGADGMVVGIGMHLLNVHVNRAPVAGRATTLLHTPGRFVSLRRDEALAVNERFTTVIEGERVRIVVVQIASRLVRRIVSYLHEGQNVATGQRIGMIKFGSQVDVVFPSARQVEVVVGPGDPVRAGVTVIGRVQPQETA